MLRIEPATATDVDAIQLVLRETWLDTYKDHLAQATLEEVTTVWHDAALIAARVQDPDLYFVVARDENAMICGLMTAQLKNGSDLFIYRLYVRPGLQHRGVGTALLSETLATFPGATRILLQVVADNEKGFAFWRKHGFTEYGVKNETVAGETFKVTAMERLIG
jgi:ribosomal protein S18 acetylase RimI-like enzyme